MGASAAAAVTAFGLPVSAQGQTMKFASATLNDVQHQFQKLFKEKLESQMDGQEVELYPASQLGPIPRMVEGVMFGTIEAFITATAFLSQVDPRFQAFDVAGLFQDPNRTRSLLSNDDFRARIQTYGNDRNIEPIATFAHSPNTIISKRPLTSLDDLRGLKVRVLGTPFQVEPIKALGATPVPMPLSEVMPAIQTGTIDAVISAPTVASAFRYYDAAPHMMMVPSWPLIVTVAASRSWLSGLPQEAATSVRQIAQEAELEAVQWGEADVQKAAETWAENGGVVSSITPEIEEALQSTISESTQSLVSSNDVLANEVDALRKISVSLG